MKKNKLTIRPENKEGLFFLIYNLLTYMMIFVILGFVAVFAIDQIFYENARQEITDYAAYISSDVIEDLNVRPINQRMIIAFFDDTGTWVSGEPQDFLPEYRYKINTREKDEIRIEILRNRNLPFESTSNVEVHYLTLLIDVESDLASYAKIYINIDGEVNARNAIIQVYIICALFLFISSIFASYFLSRRSMKPIVRALEKQTAFVSDASHELRTPLSIIQSKIENVLTHPEKTVYDVSEDLAISLKELSRLTKLTSDLLMLARSDHETVTLNLELAHLDELIVQSVEPFSELAIIHNKTFHIQTESIQARVDKNKFNQILIILLDNALLYTKEGDQIDVVLSQTNSDILVQVKDTGIGISEESKLHIFERFYRADQARNSDISGNGLGLSIAKALVKLHKGKIWVEDNQPQGTVMIFTIPKSKSV